MFDSENSPETAESQSQGSEGQAEAPKPSLADLLKDTPETAPTGEAGETHEKAEPTEGKTLKALSDLAERLGVEVKDLYAVEVPMSDGQAMSLGALKDAVAKQEDLTQRELEVEERRIRIEADQTRAQAELKALIAALPPKAISEQVLQLVRQKAEAELAQERKAVMQSIPEWADESRRNAELQGMVAYLGDYGFPPTYLQGAFDHRLIRLVRDGYLRKMRVEQALAKVQEVKRPSTTGKSSPAGAAKKPGGKPANPNLRGPSERLKALLDS